MSTIVEKYVRGYGPYYYEVTHLGGGKQKWRWIGKGLPSGVEPGPVTNDNDPTNDAEPETRALEDILRDGAGFEELVADLKGEGDTGIRKERTAAVENVEEQGYNVIVDGDERIEIIPKFPDGPLDRMAVTVNSDGEWIVCKAGESMITYAQDSEHGLMARVKDPDGYQSLDFYEKDNDLGNAIKMAVRMGSGRDSQTGNRYELTKISGISDSKVDRMMWKFDDVDDVFAATQEELEEIPGIGAGTARNILKQGNENLGEKSTDVARLRKYVPRIDRKSMGDLAREFDSREAVANASVGELSRVYGIGDEQAENIKWAAEKVTNGVGEPEISYDEARERADSLKERALQAGVVSSVTEKDENADSLNNAYGFYRYADESITLQDSLPDERRNSDQTSRDNISYAKTLAHEIGHALHGPPGFSGSGGYNRTAGIAKEVAESSSSVRQELDFLHEDKMDDGRDMNNERFANLIAGLTTRPEQTKEHFPNAVKKLEEVAESEMDPERRAIVSELLDDDL